MAARIIRDWMRSSPRKEIASDTWRIGFRAPYIGEFAMVKTSALNPGSDCSSVAISVSLTSSRDNSFRILSETGRSEGNLQSPSIAWMELLSGALMDGMNHVLRRSSDDCGKTLARTPPLRSGL